MRGRRGWLIALGLAAAAARAAAGVASPGFTDTLAVGGLRSPTALAFLGDGRLLVTEKRGALKIAAGGIATTLATIAVCSESEMGLLGIAVDPDVGRTGHVYLYRTSPGPDGCDSAEGRYNEVIRVALDPAGALVEGSQTTLLSGIQTDNGNHDGGCLRIGPDGNLYVAVGDTGRGDGQPPGFATNPYAQDLAHLEGKILRLERDGTVPVDNPFVDRPGARGEVFASGFRNPWRMGFAPVSGTLWVADVGDGTVEEIDVVRAGGNYGWPRCEGLLPAGCGAGGDVPPVYTYRHDQLGRSIIGGAFAGAALGGHAGDYVFGDFVASTLFALRPNAARDGVVGDAVPIVTQASGPVDIVAGADGAIYYVALNSGQVRRVAAIDEGTTSTSTSTSSSTTTTSSTSTRPEAPLPSTTTTSVAPLQPDRSIGCDVSGPARLRCPASSLRAALDSPMPLCLARCRCTIEAALARLAGRLDALAAGEMRRCMLRLRRLRAAAARAGRRVRRLAGRACVTGGERVSGVLAALAEIEAVTRGGVRLGVCRAR